MKLDIVLAGRMANIALGHVTREWPHKLDHVMSGRDDVRSPRDLHPMFFGSFDWHSCVHGWWLLWRLLRMFPDHAAATATKVLIAETFTPTKVAAELAYLAPPSTRGFERPYGWAWLLALHAEMAAVGQGAALAPLANAFATRWRDYLGAMTYPVRTGAHGNTAFALILTADWARVHDAELLSRIRSRALDWFADDTGAQAWEPDGDAFLSPTLVEASLMSRLLPGEAFGRWFAGFLPDLASERPATLFAPASVSDRSDGKIAHLDGLNLSRAWCWRSLAAYLEGDSRRVAIAAADRHLAAGLPHIAGDYAGEHWLASFALLALAG